LLTVVPPVSVVLAGVALFVAGAPRPFQFARVLGGPTDGIGPWTGRVQLLERDGDVDEPAPHENLRVEWTHAGHSTTLVAQTDDEGWAEVRLERPQGATKLELSVFGGALDTLVVRGAPELSAERWARAARRRSGVLEPRVQGDTKLSVRVMDAVLAVPFAGKLSVDASRAGEPLAGLALEPSAEGLDVVSPKSIVTDAHGHVELVVRPREHVVALGLAARTEGEALRWYAHLPVVAGALHGEVQDGRLVIRAPVAKDAAWFALVSERERIAGGRVGLTASAGGMASGSVDLRALGLPTPPRDDLWLVLSSDPDGRSPSTVGYPWGKQATTFDAVEALLLDGSRFGEEREEARRRRVRWVVGGYSLAAFALTLFLFVTRVKRANSQLFEQLAGGEASTAVPSSRSLTWGLVVAGLCLLLGFLVVLLVSLLRASP
jgi:hypothetical protein